MDDRNHGHISDYAATLIRYKARMLSRKRAFARNDREDLEHDLWVDLLKRLPKYDPSKATLNTFIARVVERKVVSLIRYHLAEKRAVAREEASLNELVRDCDGRTVERHETTREGATAWQRLHELQRDIADLREHLPSEVHRLVMDALSRGGTINSIAAELGISRRQAERHVAEIRQIFEDASLRDYL